MAGDAMTGAGALMDNAANAIRNGGRPAMKRTADAEAARKSAEAFEAFFLAQVLDSMFKGIKTDGMFGGGQAESTYRSMLLQEYGKVIAAGGGIGIADAVMRELIATQEA